MTSEDKKPQKVPTKESVQDSSSKDKHTQKPPSQQSSKEEAVKGTSKGKKPEKAPTKESVPGSSYKDKHTQKPPFQQFSKEEATPGVSKGKKPEKAPTKESVPGSSKDKPAQKPPSEQRLKEEAGSGASKGKKPEKAATKEKAVEGSSEGKKPETAPTKESVQGSSSEDKHPPKPPSEQPSKEEAVPGASKGKKPRKSAPGASKRKQKMQLPPGKTKNCMEYPIHFPLHILGSYDLLEDDADPPEDIQPRLSEKAKAKQPAPKTIPLFKIPRVSILRIPVAGDGPLQRVRVSLRGDTATRHWQTFFFKNIVCLESFWGETNDKAFVATRIVRLKIEGGKPTPYFLMVCIGEYPRITSPRNSNEVFKGMHQPIYNDAFVFKLGDPELGVAGYANYVDIDKDIDGLLGWLTQPIRNAAKNVERAMAMHANPGFPDMSNYADEETMSKDVAGMLHVTAMIKNAKMKYAAADPVVAERGLPNLERMHDRVKNMWVQTNVWKDEGLLSFDADVGSAQYQTTDAFRQKTLHSFQAIEEAVTATKLDKTPSASTDADSPSPKIKELWERAEKSYMDAKSAFEPVKTMVTVVVNDQVSDVLTIKDPNAECDTIWLKYAVDMLISSIVDMMKNPLVSAASKAGALHGKRINLLGVKAQAAYQAIEENKTYQEIIQLVVEMNDTYRILLSGSESEGL